MAKAALGAAAVTTAAVAGAIMAIDNVFGLVPLPLFGIWSDRYRGRLGRRTPFILVGSVIAVVTVPLIAAASNVGSLALFITMVIATLVAICAHRTMTVSIVADITPCPLRTKANGLQKLVGYAGTGLMLVVIAARVPKGDNPDYLPVCMIQALLIPGAAVCYGIDGSWELLCFDIGYDNYEAWRDDLGEASPEAIDHMSPGVSAEKDSPGYRISMLPNTQTLLSFEEAR